MDSKRLKQTTKLLAVGDAVAFALGVEEDGEMLVLVFDQARYGELHAASFAASECRWSNVPFSFCPTPNAWSS